eukprot:TRINITY_DN36217_c0_g1_i1.p1 TRINITY_DN36217_c0_g1~~TRINITY_DN36217_c0_g1_i1.p1  ORF type:complete len:238 (+),score=16.94 TRINITY_DN36217_c0_g1_i1:64-714(+)
MSSENKEAWVAACNAWTTCLSNIWLLRAVRSHCNSDFLATTDAPIEASCAELLEGALEGAPSGIRLSQPWREFFGDLKAPDHPAKRVPSNIVRFAGNYQNLIFLGALLATFCKRPFAAGLLCVGQAFALLSPPEIFDIDLQLPRQGSQPVNLGGARLRFVLAIFCHSALWVVLLLGSQLSAIGSLCGVILSLIHALLRTRPWTEMAKEKLGFKKSS